MTANCPKPPKILREAIKLVEKRIKADNIRVSLTDVIRLVAVESEISQGATPRRVEIKWMDEESPETTPTPNW